MENGANSTLFIAKVRKSDTGNYTCSIGPNDFYTINVHVINGNMALSSQFRVFESNNILNISRFSVYFSFSGESLAELYHGSAYPSFLMPRCYSMIDLLLAFTLLYLLMAHLHRTDC